MNGRRLAGLLAAALVLAADQGSKAWIVHGLDLPGRGGLKVLWWLNLTWVENRGITFGLLNGLGDFAPLLLTLVALAVVVALAVWLWRAERLLPTLALGAVAGGAVGNVIDRLRLGYVIDFIHAHIGVWSWYVFNVADAAIVCGVAALVLDGVRGRRPGDDAQHPSERLAEAPDQR